MKNYKVSLFIALLILVGCNQENQAKTHQDGTQNEDWKSWNSQLSDKASLIHRLNENIIFYGRVPSIWGSIFTPKGNSLSKALLQQPNQDTLERIQSALKEKIKQFPVKVQGLLNTFFYNLRAPLEVAVRLPQGSAITSSQLIFETKFNFENVEQLNALFEQISVQNPQLKLMQHANSSQPGMLFLGPMKMYFQFNPKNQRFTALTGMAVLVSEFENVLKWPETSDLPVQKMQQRLESSELGLFQWINVEKIIPFFKHSIPPAQLSILQTLGILDTQTIALGAGVSHGRGKLTLLASGKNGLIWTPLFDSTPIKNVSVAGKPQMAVGIKIPDSKTINGLVKEIAALQANPNKRTSIPDEWIKAKLNIKQKFHFSIDQFLDAISGHSINISDNAGEYQIFFPNHSEKLESFLQSLTKNNLAKIDQLKLQGESINQFSFHFNIPQKNGKNNFLNKLNRRFYYVKNQGVYFISSVPQILVDLKSFSSKVSLKNWMMEQNIQTQHDFLWLATHSQYTPRKNYYLYLNLLQSIGDLLDINIDIAKFPSANQLKLPKEGKLGLELMMGTGELGFSFDYESHMGEYFMNSNSMMSVAIIGIVTAIAIPAYHDYSTRAKISRIILRSNPAKREVENYYRSNGSFPPTISKSSAYISNEPNVISLKYDANSHHILIKVSSHLIKGRNATLHLIPKINQSGIIWQCRGEQIKKSLLPLQCR